MGRVSRDGLRPRFFDESATVSAIVSCLMGSAIASAPLVVAQRAGGQPQGAESDRHRNPRRRRGRRDVDTCPAGVRQRRRSRRHG